MEDLITSIADRGCCPALVCEGYFFQSELYDLHMQEKSVRMTLSKVIPVIFVRNNHTQFDIVQEGKQLTSSVSLVPTTRPGMNDNQSNDGNVLQDI